MENPVLTIDEIVSAIQSALQKKDSVKAMWLGGASAFNRQDEWSDIDMMIVVDDQNVEETFEQIENALTALSPIELKFRLPQPTWHGHDQAIYRLRDAGPFRLLDVAVVKLSSPDKFFQPEQHGQAVVLFDKAGVAVSPPFNWEAHNHMLGKRLQTLSLLFELFQSFTIKELRRGNNIDALAYYGAFTLRPLVELLRIRHDPGRYNFQSRYLYYDLPHQEVQRLEQLYFVGDPGELESRHAEAGAWFRALWAELATLYKET